MGLSILDYPVVFKKHQEWLTVSVPDLGIAIIEELPPGNKLNAQYMLKMSKVLARVWIKIAEELKRKAQGTSTTKAPAASSIRGILGDLKKEIAYSPEQAAKILGVHKNTIRRMVDRGKLKAIKTDGGHRRITEGVISAFLEENA